MINATELEKNVMQACLSWLDAKVADAKNYELPWVRSLGMPPLKELGRSEVYLSEVEWIITLARLTEIGINKNCDWDEKYDEYSFIYKGVKVFALGHKDKREQYASMAGIRKDTNDELEEEVAEEGKKPKRGRRSKEEVDKMRAAILKAWNGGERNIDEIVGITGYSRKQVHDYIPETANG